jgi:hypothetical protein
MLVLTAMNDRKTKMLVELDGVATPWVKQETQPGATI